MFSRKNLKIPSRVLKASVVGLLSMTMIGLAGFSNPKIFQASTETPTANAVTETATSLFASPTASGETATNAPGTATGTPAAATATNAPTMTPTETQQAGGQTPTPAPTVIVANPNLPKGKIDHLKDFKGVNVSQEQSALGFLNRRANPEGLINSNNVSNLKEGWHINTPDMVTGLPLIENNTVYFADWAGNAYAANAKTGKIIWQKQVEKPKSDWPWYGFAGTGALGNGMFFLASVEGKAFALDQKTGDIVWQSSLSDNQYAGNLGKLLFYDGKVYVGLASVQEPLSKKMPDMKFDFRGHVMALNAKTGKQVWDLPLVKAPGNGVAVWGAFAIDPATNSLFFGTGNNYTVPSTDHSDSIFSVNAQTGKVNWVNQIDSQDIWLPIKSLGGDYDFGAGPQIFNATNAQGKTMQLIGIGQKSGYYWALDRKTGRIVWHAFVGYAGVAGGMRGEASIADGMILAWSNNNSEDKQPQQHPITVKALDPATGQYIWSVEKAQPAVGWAAGFASEDVYFVGSLDGTVKAYSTKNGQILWQTTAPGPVGAPLIVSGQSLFVGAGVPVANGGVPGTQGLFTYTIGQ